ncbi:MAG: hypothetical protein ACLRSW_02740 [Christensenellaceae bacterium]
MKTPYAIIIMDSYGINGHRRHAVYLDGVISPHWKGLPTAQLSASVCP